jgi:UDP-N-acetylglucosamine 4-epimerase
VNELYASVFARSYGFDTIGLRYFNVFGPRQDPNGAYAAVIPKWIAAIMSGEIVYINGDGFTSRDFCYIDNVVQANLLSATSQINCKKEGIYNIAVGDNTSLIKLHDILQERIKKSMPNKILLSPVFCDFREGDVRHSLADITKAKINLGYKPSHNINDGILLSVEWYAKKYQNKKQ